MAHSLKQRDPFLDARTRQTVERRGRELLGLALLALGLLVAAMLGSYSPNDPGWFAATDAPAANLLGRVGAAIAAPLTIIIGLGAWGIAAVLCVWGARFVLHRGGHRAPRRAIFAPIAVALASVYASTHVPPAWWPHSFGLGGLFGDTVLGALLGIAPVGVALGLKVLAALSAAALLALTLFTLGFDRGEIRGLWRRLLIGVVLLYAGLVALLTQVARLTLAGVRRLRARRQASSSRATSRREPTPEAPARGTRLPPGIEPELVEADLPPGKIPPAAPDGAHLRERIADAVRSRMDRSADPSEAEAGSETGRGDAGPPNAAPRKVVQHPPTRPPQPSRKAEAEAQPVFGFEATAEGFEPPPFALLADPDRIERLQPSPEALEENARMLETVLDDYGVKGEIASIRPGPVVTMYELEPAPGLKASRVIGLSDDIARSMAALSARVSTVPGRSVIGIELPNANREQVLLRELLAARVFAEAQAKLPLALGKAIGGDAVIANLARMPHLLIAGTTGSGKSVAINTMILSLLYRLTPEECRLIMIDPKMLELSVYDGIPHLLSPVVTDPKKAVVALKWVVAEMEERYRKMSKMGVRNIEGYNARVRDVLAKGEMFSRTVQTGFDDDTGEPVFETEEFAPETMPYIVVIVDEMADLMMVAGKEIEACIQRLAQMARASGIHLIMATQRPSVDVITGTIKANFPTRISFQVTSKIDSRTILGEQGAEQLLGMGDMLYMAGGAKITRVHGPFVSDDEVEDVVKHLKAFGPPDYSASVVEGPDESKEGDIDQVLGLGGNTDGDAALYDQAVAIAIRDRKCSTSFIQRKLAIGYNKAARLVEQMEDAGVVSPANHVGKREILVPEEQ